MDALSNPPVGIRGEAVATGWVKQLNCTRQADIPLLHKIHKLKALALVRVVLLSNTDNKLQITTHKLPLGQRTNANDALPLPCHRPVFSNSGLHRLDLPSITDFLFRCEQGVSGDLPKVALERGVMLSHVGKAIAPYETTGLVHALLAS